MPHIWRICPAAGDRRAVCVPEAGGRPELPWCGHESGRLRGPDDCAVRAAGRRRVRDGLVRQDNEDAAYAGRWLFAVADGLGGHAAGEVASAAVIEALCSYDAEVAPEVMLTVLGRAVAEANGRWPGGPTGTRRGRVWGPR